MTPLGSLLDLRTGEPTTQELFVLLPDRPVRPGESWSRSYEREQGRSRISTQENYVLTSVGSTPAGTVARIRAMHEFSGSGGRVSGLPETIEAVQVTRFTGEYALHVERGRLLREAEETREEVRFRGTIENRPVQALQARTSTRWIELSTPSRRSPSERFRRRQEMRTVTLLLRARARCWSRATLRFSRCPSPANSLPSPRRGALRRSSR